MVFSEIQFFQFRNLENRKISLGSSREIFLVGENGQGKTNFLEALYFLCYGTSFRTKNEKKLIQAGSENFAVFATFHDSLDGFSEVKIKFSKEKKEIWLNQELIRDRKELIEMFPCIIFAHEDFLFVKGEPENQRFFFDQTAAMTDFFFLDHLRNYKKVLKSRNALLSQRTDELLMTVWEEKLIEFGIELMTARKNLVQEINVLLKEFFQKISGTKQVLSLQYIPSWKEGTNEKIRLVLDEKRTQDKELGFTSSGPHRDRFVFTLNGKNIQDVGSTGQIRLISLLLRVIQAKLTFEKTKKPPILLLDDVLLELDKTKRNAFIDILPERSQAFFTFLPDGEIKNSDSLVLNIQEGQIL